MNISTQLTRMKHLLSCLLYLVCLLPLTSDAGEALAAFSRLNRAGLVVLDANGQTVMAKHADLPLMPASTTKLATAWMALSHWGEAHRFRTDFYLDESTQTLWVKGSGDPYLVSEELGVIARNLKQRGLQQVKAIGIDTSLVSSGFVVARHGDDRQPLRCSTHCRRRQFQHLSRP